MKSLFMILVVILSFAFELFGRILHQIAMVSMEIAKMMLSMISEKD